MALSAAAGENGLSRFGQHILIGAAMGYLGALAWRDILVPTLFRPLAGGDDNSLLFPLILGLILMVAGVERMASAGPKPAPLRGWRTLLRFTGIIPAALILGTGVAVALVGMVQGTLWPQFWQAANQGIDSSGSTALLLTGVLTLLLTTAVLLALQLSPAFDLEPLPGPLRRVMLIWTGIGKRVLWLAGGILFARLVAARFSLLIAQFNAFFVVFERSGIWRWAESVWQSFVG